MEDPHPLVHGAGLAHLRGHGVEVIVGVEGDAAARQNAVFLTNIRHGRPYVILKAALSVDGKLAARPGSRTRLTGPAANRRVQRQRAEVDAIGVGSGTILADDPLLTPRGAYRGRPLARVLFDRRLRTPVSARVLSTLEAGPVIIVTSERACAADPDRARGLSAAGARLLPLPADDLGNALRALKGLGLWSIVLEGGGTLHRAAFDADTVDAVHIYITPTALGPDGVAWIGEGRISWDGLQGRRAQWLGDDILVEGHVHGHH
jgi:diaminohydroxyphosphoribosylaminopyrimidine deaminase/5-amino-6-(5-phosphoribosylamino)uracil reductase